MLHHFWKLIVSYLVRNYSQASKSWAFATLRAENGIQNLTSAVFVADAVASDNEDTVNDYIFKDARYLASPATTDHETLFEVNGDIVYNYFQMPAQRKTINLVAKRFAYVTSIYQWKTTGVTISF
ncbi:hypothetical protein AVEN_109209-1 [Araneus ventricosus]|uniref:Uncharacterized protein n=1 Tax=Araneus ventricosus TaxID=182803 RepID=A0A4Y2EX13_ARAVE|nr:hypothetical protein AVEN_225588-1 [Araneus ventricosus]GBM33713.1 hypothetical protein AVEN_244043-1 [Araneus ventricosus]GBM33726.1 hypothetical protein AVEN_55700-1 [Araneus ventricosus]GBM33760.1 hypothetical protein AVEN_109209-1 [Araneus ventricosus]